MILLKRPFAAADMLRAYKIVLDGRVVGTIRCGKTVQVAVSPGRHTLRLQIDWCYSNAVEFDNHGQALVFECGNNFSGMRLFSGVRHLVAPSGDYLWLRQLCARADR